MEKNIYKTIDLFGNEKTHILPRSRKKRNLFGEYDKFIDKFNPKKTTDDCFTPQNVYDIVLRYVKESCNIAGKRIIRPFYPDGDYKALEYKPNDVVIDNPQFSILAQIIRFYLKNNIPFFLFASHMTLFSSDQNYTAIVVGVDIEYENGAKVKTSFVSNMFGSLKIIGEPLLYRRLNKINEQRKGNLPAYEYPPEVLTVSMVARMVLRGVGLKLNKSQVQHVSGLESQRVHKKSIFGSGFLLSKSAVTAKEKAEKRVTRCEKITKDQKIVWSLSEKELSIIRGLK